jgi:hypothetical protein
MSHVIQTSGLADAARDVIEGRRRIMIELLYVSTAVSLKVAIVTTMFAVPPQGNSVDPDLSAVCTHIRGTPSTNLSRRPWATMGL